MDSYYVNGQLFHHGIKGQKWGVRRFQNADGSLTPAGERRYQRLNNALQRNIRKQTKYDNKLLGVRAKNIAKLEAKYDKKIAKTKTLGQRDALIEKKKAVLADFELGTKAIKTALKTGNDNRNDFLRAKMKAISDPAYKNSDEYKKAKQFSQSQIFSERFYGKSYTVFAEAMYVAAETGVSWTRGKLED